MADRNVEKFQLQFYSTNSPVNRNSYKSNYKMIIQLQPDISDSQKDKLIQKVNGIGYKITEVKTQLGDYLIGIGKKEIDIRQIGQMDGIIDIHIVSDEYKLVSKKWKASQLPLIWEMTSSSKKGKWLSLINN